MVKLNTVNIQELGKICPDGVRSHVDLSAISQWRIGGVADLIISPSTASELARLLRWFAAEGIEPLVIGMTSNLLFSDDGVKVPIIKIGSRMSDIEISGNCVVAQAGAWVPMLARKLMLSSLGGGEHICGIPGTLGGLICMNGGSQRKGIGSNVVTVASVDRSGIVLSTDSSDCGFSYRTSIYQNNEQIITGATMKFPYQCKSTVRKEMLSIMAERRSKFPRKEPNCGSVFKSNPAMYSSIGPPGSVIENLGLKGLSEGGAKISNLHGNFIIHDGHATAHNVLSLIRTIVDRVHHSTGFTLEAEVRYVSSTGSICSADQALGLLS